MNMLNHILAAGGNDFGKVFIGVVFFLLWLINGVLSANAKRKQQQQRERVRETISPSPIPRVVPPQEKRSRLVKKIFAKQKAPILASGPAMETVSIAAAREAAETIPQIARPISKHPAINAKAINAWLRPTTLRQQFILTEIFQSPLALRDHGSAGRVGEIL
jgi:hypothetical protein